MYFFGLFVGLGCLVCVYLGANVSFLVCMSVRRCVNGFLSCILLYPYLIHIRSVFLPVIPYPVCFLSRLSLPPRALGSFFGTGSSLLSLHAVLRRLIYFLFCSCSLGTEYSSRSDTRLPQTELRANIFHETPTALTPPNGPSMPPLRENSLSSFSRHPAIATATNEHDIETQGPTNDDLFSQLPGGKRRKFILVDDPQRGCRVRVKVVLDKVNMDEIPDSYRESNAVYPRTYFPIQMRDQHRVVPAKRFFLDDPETQEDDPDEATLGRTTVPMPSLDGDTNTSIEVPKISRKRHRKELLLNDLGYRMSWSQSRVFSGRMLFLQRSCKCLTLCLRVPAVAGSLGFLGFADDLLNSGRLSK